MFLDLVTILVPNYDQAVDFFVGVLGFELVEDYPSLTNDGRPKRWVVVRPPLAQTGFLLAQADGVDQQAVIGGQFAGRVGLFLRVNDFPATYDRLRTMGIEFLTEPREEPYGTVAVFRDPFGTKWDLLSERPSPAATAG